MLTSISSARPGAEEGEVMSEGSSGWSGLAGCWASLGRGVVMASRTKSAKDHANISFS